MVVALDLRGHGFSDKPSAGYELDHHILDILQLIDALQLQIRLFWGIQRAAPLQRSCPLKPALGAYFAGGHGG